MDNLYDYIGVSQNATQAEIKKRINFLINAYHPDKFHALPKEQQEQAEAEMKKLNAASSILSNPEKRRKYDDELKRQKSTNKQSTYSSDRTPPQTKSPPEPNRYHSYFASIITRHSLMLKKYSNWDFFNKLVYSFCNNVYSKSLQNNRMISNDKIEKLMEECSKNVAHTLFVSIALIFEKHERGIPNQLRFEDLSDGALDYSRNTLKDILRLSRNSGFLSFDQANELYRQHMAELRKLTSQMTQLALDSLAPKTPPPNTPRTVTNNPEFKWKWIVGLALAIISIILISKSLSNKNPIMNTSVIVSTATREVLATPQGQTKAPALIATKPVATKDTCKSWDAVKRDDLGKRVCVFGTVRKFDSYEWEGVYYFNIRFSDDPGGFRIIAMNSYYPNARQNDCIELSGKVIESHNVLMIVAQDDIPVRDISRCKK
ncbi:MAG TPA: J domain-containing protein [Bellilinea sp.]|nr:J domain-containing protein [Bellilinea sp.]